MKQQTRKNNRISQTTYMKVSDNLYDTLEELRSNFNKISKLLFPKEEEAPRDMQYYYDRIATLISEHTPNPETRENILWEFKVSARSVNIKTDQFMALGWNFRNTPDGSTNVAVFVTLFGKYGREAEILEDLEYTKIEQSNKTPSNSEEK